MTPMAGGVLDGQVALITGAARGQGRSHALALAALGAHIVACDVPGPMHSVGYPLATAEDLDATARLVAGTGRECLAVATDVRDPLAVDRAVSRAVERFGRLDIAIANAGIVSTGPLVDVSDLAWQELLATNLSGVFHTLRAVVPPMQSRRHGRIVVTASMGGRMGIKGQSAYNATKFGVIGLAKSLALEVAGDGITVNVVCPSTVLTPMVQPDPAVPLPDEVVQRLQRPNPIPRPWLQPEDVTKAVVYLVTDPGVISGSVLEVGLGASARLP